MALQNWSSFPALPAVLLLAAAGVVVSLMKKRSETSRSSSTPSSPSSSYSSSAATTRPLPAGDYEVFVSFRGPDVRTTFADFLYRFLDNSNVRTFFDDEELRKGEGIAESLFKAIEESKVYIPILSPDYASSKWCLQELSRMVRCWKQGNGSILLPIFFMMEPRDVRHQQGSYKKAFQQHRKKYNTEAVKEWKEALELVGEMKGWHVTEFDGQGAIVRDVFSRVRSHLMSSYLLVTEKLVGIDFHIEQVTTRLNQGVKVVGIVGMGGLGKTTIAMAVRDKVYTEFDCCCFLRDVRETLLGKGGILALQKQILSTIPGHVLNIQDASQGIRMIKDRICQQKALIIIDDVDENFEFRQVLGKLEDFCSESRFVITTRNKRVFDFSQHESYEPADLSHDCSLQLFSRHAFGSDYPPEDRVALSNEFLKVTTGLPLALKVIGSSLMRKNEWFWEEKLKQLRKIPPAEVQERLMISFLDLAPEEQEIFLDIASIFIGNKKEHPIYMWNACDFYPEIGVDTLILKSLVKCDERNEFWMHDSIRDLGRAIVSKKDPWKQSRIWSNEDALDMLTNGKGTDRVDVLKVDMYNQTFALTTKQFEKLSGLRFLEVSFGKFKGNFKRILPNIRWLQLIHCGSLPVDLNMKKLVVFHIGSCKVRDDWSGWVNLKDAHNLKSLTIDGCEELLKVPDLSQCGNLELVNLKNCSEISGELYIGSLRNLKRLTFNDTGITKLIGDIAMLRNLKEIHTSFLEELPDGMDRLTKLEILTIQSSTSNAVLALPTSLKELQVESGIHIPNLSDLNNLEVLKLEDYAHQLPEDIWKLSRLKTLKLWRFGHEGLLVVEEEEVVENGMDVPTCLPSSLQVLDIGGVQNLDGLHLANLSNLTRLSLRCTSVREILGLAELRMLNSLRISEAPNLINLDGLGHLTLLKEMILEYCTALERLPNVRNFTKLKKLEIHDCPLLSQFAVSFEVGDPSSSSRITDCLDLPDLEPQEYVGPTELLLTSPSNLSHPRRLEFEEISGKPLLSQGLFLHFSGLHNLNALRISKWERLTEVTGIETLESVGSVYIKHCTSLTKLSSISGLKNLEMVEIDGCEQLTEVMGLEKLESLQKLKMTDCASIKKLSLSCLELLPKLDTSRCTQLTEISGLGRLKSLTKLCISDCKSIENLPNLSDLKLIRHLDVSGCTQLTEVVGLEKMESLQSLKMTNCVSIQKLPDLSGFQHLRKLDISGCTQVTEIVGIENLQELSFLTIDERLNIPPLEQRVRITRK